MHDPVRVQVLDRAKDGADELGCVVLEEVRFGADSVEELTALAEVGYEVDCGKREGGWSEGRRVRKGEERISAESERTGREGIERTVVLRLFEPCETRSTGQYT